MSFEPREFLRHILTECDYLLSVSAGLTPAHLASDQTLQRAVVRSLAIIGEAAKRVPFVSGYTVINRRVPGKK